jgi:hypothetical protein
LQRRPAEAQRVIEAERVECGFALAAIAVLRDPPQEIRRKDRASVVTTRAAHRDSPSLAATFYHVATPQGIAARQNLPMMRNAIAERNAANARSRTARSSA